MNLLREMSTKGSYRACMSWSYCISAAAFETIYPSVKGIKHTSGIDHIRHKIVISCLFPKKWGFSSIYVTFYATFQLFLRQRNR